MCISNVTLKAYNEFEIWKNTQSEVLKALGSHLRGNSLCKFGAKHETEHLRRKSITLHPVHLPWLKPEVSGAWRSVFFCFCLYDSSHQFIITAHLNHVVYTSPVLAQDVSICCFFCCVFSPTFHITLHFCSGHSRRHPGRQTDAIFVHSPHSEVIGSPLGQAVDGQLTHFHRGVIALDPVLSSWLASARCT